MAGRLKYCKQICTTAAYYYCVDDVIVVVVVVVVSKLFFCRNDARRRFVWLLRLSVSKLSAGAKVTTDARF